MKYTVILEPQEEGGYTVRCLELPGAISQGETREEALANIKETIELVLEVQRPGADGALQCRGPEGGAGGCLLSHPWA